MRLPEDSLVFAFSPEEEQVYDLQITVLQTNLLGAPDELSNYTCHSIPHIREVLEQAEHLFNAAHDWLAEEIGLTASEWLEARMHLLLAAKLHDVGMCGTERLRRLLFHVDEMQQSIFGSSSAETDRRRKSCAVLERLAREADEELLGWDRPARLMNGLCSRILCADPSRTNMSELTAQYHEMVKYTIRRYHAENSARWIAAKRDVLERRYGTAIDWSEVALLAALHNGGLERRVDPAGNRRPWTEYGAALCSRIGLDAAFLLDEHRRRRTLALASILRIADQRRSGSRLMTLDQREIRVRLKADGALQAEYEYAGVTRRPGISGSNRIILAEKLNEFGKIALKRIDNKWVMVHELNFALPEHRQARALLIGKRIPTYVEEIHESLFRVCHDFGHVFCIRLDRDGEKQPFDERLTLGVEELIRLGQKDGWMEDHTGIAGRIDQALERFSTVWIEAIP